jgi:hypothetical protein
MAAAVSTVLYSLILVAADQALGLPVPPMRLALQLTVAASAYNALLMPLVLLPVVRVQALMRVTPQT